MKYFGFIRCLLVLLTCLMVNNYSMAYEASAPFIYVKNLTSQDVLLARNAHERMYPASMTKMMTAYVAFDALKQGKISLDNIITVSRKAYKIGGSKMFLREGERVTLDNILKGVIIQSGNDASIALAEFIAGSEEFFAERMNGYAKKLGMNNSNFVNASGWPDDNHYTTAYDLSLLVESIITDFPEYYWYYNERSFTWDGIEQHNRNPIFGFSFYKADGLKTGHTKKSGYGFAGSATRQGQRLIVIVNGLQSKKQRREESHNLLVWGFEAYDMLYLFANNKGLADVKVKFSEQPHVSVGAKASLPILLYKKNQQQPVITLHSEAPLSAPISKGDVVGTITVTYDDAQGQTITKNIDAVALDDVKEVGFVGRIWWALYNIIFGL